MNIDVNLLKQGNTVSNLLKEIIKNPPILLIIAGILFILIACSVFNLPNVVSPQMGTQNWWILLTTGCMFIFIALMWLIYNQIKLSNSNYVFKGVSSNKYSVFLNKTETQVINIIYGNLKDVGEYKKDTLFILPANDKFDDDCIDDEKSVLGSFVNNLYPYDNKNIKQKIRDVVDKKSFEKPKIGNWILITSEAKGEKIINMGMVAVTELTDKKAIIAHPENVMLAFNSIHEIINETRATKVFIPLLGSGNGGLTPELSLLYLVISIMECTRKVGGHNIKEANIVIYKKDKKKVDLSVKRMRTVVNFALSLYDK
jgi:hypothetical protein